MRIAKHPSARGIIAAEQYQAEFGSPALGQSRSVIKKASCLFCKVELEFRPKTPNRIAHFSHPVGAGFCPSKADAGAPYLDLSPRQPDSQGANALRRSFRQNWRYHYRFLGNANLGMIPMLSVEEFIGLLDEANRRNIWAHVDLTERLLPFVMALSLDYPPWTGLVMKGKLQRQLWFRYFFTHQVQAVQQIWTLAPGVAQMFRISFKAPKSQRGRPNYQDVTWVEEVNMAHDFLSGPEPQLPAFIVKRVEVWFARHPGFGR